MRLLGWRVTTLKTWTTWPRHQTGRRCRDGAIAVLPSVGLAGSLAATNRCSRNRQANQRTRCLDVRTGSSADELATLLWLVKALTVTK